MLIGNRTRESTARRRPGASALLRTGGALALLITRIGAGAALAVRAAFGLALYLVNFCGMTAIFPWFAMARNWVSIFAHVIFRVISAWWYKARAHPAEASHARG